MTRADLEEMVEAQLPEFYKMLLGDAETVVMHHQGFPMRRLHCHNGFWFAEVSVFDFQRSKKGLRANALADQQPAR